jgi:coenzyme F420-reducing hydrogenase beta subunit
MKALKETIEKIKGDAKQQILKQMGGMEMFLPALLDENNKDPELVRLRKKYKAQIEEDRLQLDAFRLLKTKQSRYTESELKEAIKRIRAARDPNNLAPEALPIDGPAGAAKRLKERQNRGTK